MALDQNALNSLRIDRDPQRYNADGNGKRRTIGIITALVIVLAIAAWWWLRQPTIEVHVAPVTATHGSGNAAVLDASGYVVARRQATVSAKVTGKVMEVRIEEGMQVKEGQVLATLDTSTTSRQLELADQQLKATRAQMTQVQVRLDEARRNEKRAVQLRDSKMISQADLEAAQANTADLQAQLAALQSQVSVSEASVRVQRQAMDDLTVRAPFSGVVISKDAQPGEMVSPISAGGGFTRTGIATIVDMDSREVEVDVNEAFINRVTDGQRAEAVLDAYPDWVIPSHVISIVPTADRQKATVKVRIGFDKLDPRILPDMGVKVRFLDNNASNTPSRNALQAPSGAVISSDGKQYVWRVKDDTVERVAVSTGQTAGDRIEIQSGVSEGDSLVLQPDAALREGDKVKVQGP